MSEALERLIQAIEGGKARGCSRGPFERRETHGSVVLVSKEAAYKLKKPVKFDVFDYGTVEQRAEMCRREIALNRRLAPEVYVRAAAVFESADDDYEFEVGEAGAAGEPLEWIVEMAAVPEERLLFQRVDRYLASPEELRRVGRRIADFHLAEEPLDPALGDPDRLGARLGEHISALSAAPPEIVNPGRLESVGRFLGAWLDCHGSVLRRRAQEGWVRDGHGDLRLEHVVVAADAVQVIDCVEFDSALRACDVLGDLSFLVMELELAQRPDLIQALLQGWAEGGCPLEEQALWFFAALKALIRTEVAVHRAAQLEAEARGDDPEAQVRLEATRAMGRSLLELAKVLAWRAHGPIAIALAGLSGSGKTAVSKRLHEDWGIARVSSDEVRKQLVGVGRDELAPDHAYEDYVSEVVYENLGRHAAEVVASGGSIVVDGTFRRPEDQRRFTSAFTGDTDAPLLSFALNAHDEVLRARVADRSDRGGSDADIAVLEEQFTARDAGRELVVDGLPIDTSAPVASVVAEIELAVLEALGHRCA